MTKRKLLGTLPAELTDFVGRSDELADIVPRLSSARFVTLTGPWGVGKTRLAIRAALMVSGDDNFPDGSWWVDLAPLSDADALRSELIRALGAQDRPDLAGDDVLVDHLDHKRTLLVLDNCEHLAEACRVLISSLLAGCPDLTVLATSRVALHVPGESVWPVRPFEVPVSHDHADLDTLADVPAIRLFLNRALAAAPGFTLTRDNAAPVIEICRRLEGLPLAIELAAARTRVLTARQIDERLDDSFRLLAQRDDTAATRHGTIEAALDWSYSLLGESSRKVFRRLSVFADRFTLEAAETIASDDTVTGPDVLDLLSNLVEQSLVTVSERRGGHRIRYRLLLPVRHYALAKLREAGDERPRRDRHLAYCLRVAEEVAPDLTGPDQGKLVARLEREHFDLRAALEWAEEQGDAASGLRLVTALNHFWEARGSLTSARMWIERLLALPPGGEPPVLRIEARRVLGWMAAEQGDLAAARAAHEANISDLRGLGDEAGLGRDLAKLGAVHVRDGGYEAAIAALNEGATLCRASGQSRELAMALNALGVCAMEQGDYQAAERYYEDAVVIHRELGDPSGVALLYNNLGNVFCGLGEYDRAVRRYEAALGSWRDAKHRPGVALTLNNLAFAELHRGRYDQAARYLEECLVMEEQLGRKPAYVMALTNLADVELRRYRLDRCLEMLREVVDEAHAVDSTLITVEALEVVGRLLVETGRYAAPARILGNAEAVREVAGAQLHPGQTAPLRAARAACRSRLGTRSFGSAWTDGRDMTLEEALALAKRELAAIEPGSLAAAHSEDASRGDIGRTHLGTLTPREREVAGLVAQGLTNEAIAKRLNVVPKTVEKHVSNILLKLGFERRVQVVAWAVTVELTSSTGTEGRPDEDEPTVQ